jgi:hypothetical protein
VATPEARLVDAVTRGQFLDLTNADDRTIPASVIRDIMRGKLAPDPDPLGLRLRGALIEGRLDLENVTSTVWLVLSDCELPEGIIASDADLPGLSFNDCRLDHPSEPPVYLPRLTTGMLELERTTIVGHTPNSSVDIAYATISGVLNCSAATLRNDSGRALQADGAAIGHAVFLGDGFEATGAGAGGAVRLVGTRIGGSLNFDGARLRNDSGPALDMGVARIEENVFMSEDFHACGAAEQGTVQLIGTQISGRLYCSAEHVLGTDGAVTINFFGTQIGSQFTYTPNPRATLNVAELTYSGLPLGVSPSLWLKTIRENTPYYDAQPYQQLAAGHRAAGDDGSARRVLMAQRRDQIDRHALTGRAERTWARFTGFALGYGYQPWRALIGLAAVVAVSVTLALIVGDCGIVDRIGFGLNVGAPLVTTNAVCATTSETAGHVLTVSGWLLKLLAWAFASLFIAGFTGAVRKS